MEETSEFQELKQLTNVIFRAVDFIHTFFPNENKPWEIIKLTDPQIDAIDSIQFGFPLRQFDFQQVKKAPRGIVMIWPRQTGKTSACAYAACALLFLIPHCSIGIISATEKQAKKLYRKIKNILRNSILWKYVVQKTLKVDFLELVNGNYVEVWPCTEGVKGSTYTFLFADEAALMDENILFAGALPTVTHGKRWIMLSTPYGPKGKFIEFYFKGLDTRPIICNACGDSFPQAAFNVDRFPCGVMPIDEMHPCPMCGAKDYSYGLGSFTVPWVDPWNDGLREKEYVEALLDEDGWSPWSRQEYLAEIISDASMVFLGEWITNCTNNRLTNRFRAKKNLNYSLGADYGRKHDASCFYVTHRDVNTGKIVLDFGMSVAGEFDHQKTYKYIREKLCKVMVEYNPLWVVPDATGLGDPLVEELEQDIKALRKGGIPLKTHIFSNRTNQLGYIISRVSKPDLIGNLIKLFSTGMIEIPPASEPEMGKLKEELLRFECDDVPGSEYIKYGTQSFHDDRVIALALSVWGHRQRPSIIDQIKIRGVKINPYGEFYE